MVAGEGDVVYGNGGEEVLHMRRLLHMWTGMLVEESGGRRGSAANEGVGGYGQGDGQGHKVVWVVGWLEGVVLGWMHMDKGCKRLFVAIIE